MKFLNCGKTPQTAVELLQKITPVYGSQGRALQVATEILIRQKHPIILTAKVKQSGQLVVAKYKLLPRTIELIDRLTPTYGSRGAVVAACAQLLEHPA